MVVVRAALAAADAGQLVRRALAHAHVADLIRAAAGVDVVAAGKAAAPMLEAFAEHARVPMRHVLGVSAESRAGLYGPPWRGVKPRPTYRVEWHVASHPVPDERSVAAARQVIERARGAGERDLLVVLLSGGASSLMALPAADITLTDKQRTFEVLLEQGAEIHAMNAVRKHLSAVKGGQLAAAASGTVLTLAVSDVVDDDLSAIGSGPTVPDATTFEMALAALARYGGAGRYPPAVVARLDRGAAGRIPETPKPGDPRLARATAHVAGGRRTAMEGARLAAESLGYAVHVVDAPVVGEAHVAGRALVEEVSRLPGAGLCVIASGETTVHVTGAGKGGRNQECALGMLGALDRLGPRVVAASLGTDGVDGPTDAAGAIVDSTTLARATAASLEPERGLIDNNAYVFFDRLGDLIRTGPTPTNVGDVQVILVGGGC